MAKRAKAPEGGDPDDATEATAEPAVAPKKRKPRTTVRQTYDMPFELDFRLTGVAKFARMRKSAFALKLIEQGVGGYKIDKSLKAAWAEIQGQDVSIT